MAIELVSEIVSRTTEVCQLFKMLQFPNGTPMAKKISEDRRKRLTDVHTILVSHFRTLNAIHTRLHKYIWFIRNVCTCVFLVGKSRFL